MPKKAKTHLTLDEARQEVDRYLQAVCDDANFWIQAHAEYLRPKVDGESA